MFEVIKAVMLGVGLGAWLFNEARQPPDSPNIILQATLQRPDERLSVAFSRDGKLVASGGSESIQIWDVGTRQERVTLKGHRRDGVFDVAFSPDGKTLASGCGDGTVRLWNVANGKERFCFPGYTHRFLWPDGNCLAFSPDGKMLASGGEAEVRLWNVVTGKRIATLHDESCVCSIAYSQDGKTLAVGGVTVRLWDSATGKVLAVLLPADMDTVTSVAISPDGKSIAAGGWVGTLRLWDVATRKERMTISLEDNCIYGLAFSPDSKTVVAGSGGWFKLWDAATGRELGAHKGHRGLFGTGLAFRSDGKTLATCDEGIKLWDVSRVLAK